MDIQWGILAYGAVCVVAWVEWVKGWLDGENAITNGLKNIKFHIWRIALPVISFLVALIIGGPWHQILINWQGIFAIGQLGYDTIVANVKDLIKKRVA